MANNLTLSVTLTGDGRQLSGTLKDARNDVREFGTTTERESRKADTALTAPGRSAVTVSDHLRDTQREARNFGTETVQSSRQATQALSQTSDQTQTVNGYFSHMRTLVMGVGAALVGVFGARSVINQAGLINDADALANSIGIATSELQAWDYAAQRTGLSAGTIGDIFKDVSDKLGDFAATGGGEAADLFENLNLQVSELLRLSPDQQLLAIAEALSSIEDPSQRVFYLESLANDATRLLPLLENNAAGLRTLTDEAYSLGVAMNQVDIDNALQADRAMAQLQGTVQGFLNLLAADLGPVMADTVGNFTDFIQEAGGADQVLTTLTDTALVLATLMAGRYVGAIAASQAALATKNAVVATTTGALNVLTGATTRQAAAATAMAGATRVAHGALSLLGGPIGLLVGAGGLLYVFREELGLVEAGAENAATAIATSSAAIRDGSQAALDSSYEGLTLELEAVSLKAQEAMARLTELTARQRFYENSHEGMSASVSAAISQEEQVMAELWARQVQIQRAQRENREAKESLTNSTRQNSQETEISVLINRELAEANTEASKAANELAQSTQAQADALEDLRNRLRPGRREVVQLADDMRTLTLAIATGTGNVAENIQMMGLLQQRYIEAQNDTDNLANASDDAANRIASSFTTWGTVADNSIRRVDDSGKDLWLGLIDGSRNAMDTVKRGIQQSLAEIAHMLTTQKFTVQVAGMLGLDTTGMAGGGGGFNLSSLGSLGRSASSLLGFGGSAAAPSLAMQGGLSSAALASAGQVAGGAAYGGWAGSAASGAALGNAASGGIMSAITSGVSAAMPWIAGGLAIDSLLGGGITKAIGSLFGGGKTNPHLNIDTRATDNYGHGSVRTGAFGSVGFAQGTRRSNDLFGGIPEEREFLAAVAASDDLLASLARSPEELDRMATAVQGVRLSASNVEGIMGQLSNRTVAAVKAIDGDFGAFVSSLGTDVDTIIARTQSAMAALNLLGSASENLNLQFDASATGALRAADNIAQFAGGVDQLNQLQNAYYQAYFTDAERAANLQRELTSAVGQLGYALPSTRDGFRALIEQQNQMTESGQRNCVQLLQLAGGFDQLQTLLQQTSGAVDGVSQSFEQMLANANTVIADAEAQVRQAWQTFDRQSFSQQIELLNLMGDAEGALALERERELATIDEALRPTQERIWAIQDEIAVQQNATQAARNYQNEVARVRDQLNQQLGNIGNWLDQQQATSGTPEMNLATAQEQLARQLVLIDNGDRTALQNITQYAQQVLEANKAYNASSAAGQRIQEDVYAAIRALPDAISAEEYLATEIRDALQSVVISAMPTDERLAFELSRELIRLDTNQLTVSQVRTALAPIATDAEISKLIREVDTNGDGIITRQELGNARLSGLAGGIGATLKPMFDAIDLDASGLIDWNEFYGAFKGLASDQELKRIFAKLDADGSGTISRLEALNRSNEGTEENTDSLEKQARDQLRELNGLVSEMSRSTDQFVGLNTTMVSLRESINALGVANAERARIERERAAAEQAERDRIKAERDASVVSEYKATMSEYQKLMRQANAADANYVSAHNSLSSAQKAFQNAQIAEGNNSDATVRVAQRYGSLAQARAEIARRREMGWGNSADTIEAYWQLQNAQRGVQGLTDPTPYVKAAQDLLQVIKSLEQTAKERGIKLNGSHADGLWSVPFDGYVAELHRNEMVVPAETAGRLRDLPDRSTAMSNPLPRFPLLGNNDIVETLRDLKREVAELRRDNARLQGESNKHLAAANNQRGAAATQQIAATERGNRMLKKMEDEKRLEAAKR